MSVIQSIEDSGPSRKRLKIEVPAPAVDAEMSRVVQEFSREAKLPGFRKGKIPAGVVRQRFKEDIEREVVERLLPRYWRQAEAESGVKPLIQPEVEGVEFKVEEPLVFTVGVDIRPEVEIGELGDFELPDPAVAPTDDELSTAIDSLRRQAGTWAPVERTAAQGDQVKGTLVEQIRDPETEEDQESEPSPFEAEVGDPQVWEELSVAITGLAAGQEASFYRQAPAPPPAEPALEGVPQEPLPTRRYKARVESVSERELPELDDAFAGKVGSFETVDELRQAVRADLERRKEHQRGHDREASLLDQLRQRYPLELPERVVGREIELMLRDQAERLAQQGIDLEKVNLDWQAMGEQIKPQAQARVHARLLLDAVVESEDVQVTEQEFETTLSEIARAQNTNTLAVRQSLDKREQLGPLKAQLARDKALRTLLGDEPEPAPEEGAEEAPAGATEPSASSDP